MRGSPPATKDSSMRSSLSSLRFTWHYGGGRNLDAQDVKIFETATDCGCVEDQPQHVNRANTLRLVADDTAAVRAKTRRPFECSVAFHSRWNCCIRAAGAN